MQKHLACISKKENHSNHISGEICNKYPVDKELNLK